MIALEISYAVATLRFCWRHHVAGVLISCKTVTSGPKRFAIHECHAKGIAQGPKTPMWLVCAGVDADASQHCECKEEHRADIWQGHILVQPPVIIDDSIAWAFNT